MDVLYIKVSRRESRGAEKRLNRDEEDEFDKDDGCSYSDQTIIFHHSHHLHPGSDISRLTSFAKNFPNLVTWDLRLRIARVEGDVNS